MIQKQFTVTAVTSDNDTVSVHTHDVIKDAADSRVTARSLRRSKSNPVYTACDVTI